MTRPHPVKKAILMLLILLVSCLAFPQPGLADSRGQVTDPNAKAKQILAELTPAERVGQLFLVSFTGSVADETSQIYDLITTHHVGGVVLQAANGNFVSGDQTIPEAHRLITDLQAAEWQEFQQPTPDPFGIRGEPGAYIPLLIAVSQGGDGYPSDQILSGLTPLPSAMAMGATWQPDLARQIGNVLGGELRALGINLLLGPSLDVLEPGTTESGVDIGIRSFGGDPYWVQEMGRAYTAGIHQGGAGRVAVVAKHFPGQGSADRIPEDEVASIRKSLDQLRQIDLVPFFAVTGNASNRETTADGLLVSHTRYQGFQDNIRDTTRPVSLDPNALTQILNLPEIQTWYRNGGVIVSNDLGARSVRRFYDPTLTSFDARRVARDALTAGNDLLYVNNFTGNGEPDSYNTIVQTLESFIQKYAEDPVFATRVDDSVLRILTLKVRLYPTFDLGIVLPDQENLASIANNPLTQQAVFDVARNAVTLISPVVSELPKPPEVRERLVFLTDTMTGRQCPQCPEEDEMAEDALEEHVARLYGSEAGGQVSPSRMSSYSFTDLNGLLNSTIGTETEPNPLEVDLQYADWIIFSTLNVSKERPNSDALRRFLTERPDLYRDKKMVVFAFNAPYYLDSTDISKLTAYYALYSKIPTFVEMAARVLFQELTPETASPVSIPGIGYDLIDMTAPDPNQIIPLSVEVAVTSLPPGAQTTASTPVPSFKQGDTIPLQTGVIYDHNGHPVPDDTVVRFIVTIDGGAAGTEQIDAFTGAGRNPHGKASTEYQIEKPGLLEIRVESEPAKSSQLLRLNITSEQPAIITAIAPTVEPTVTPTVTPTLTPTPTPTEPAPIPLVVHYPTFADWVLAMLVITMSCVLVYFAGIWWGSMRWGFRWGLCAGLGGLIAYSYLVVGLPGGQTLTEAGGTSGVMGFTFLGVVVGIGGGLVWRAWLEQKFVRRP